METRVITQHGPEEAATAGPRAYRPGVEQWRIGGGPLSEDDLTMIGLFADGLCIDRVARRMYLSERTVRRRSRSLCDRLGAGNITQVVAWAARRRLI